MNDVTVIGNVLLADGIGRQSIGLIGAIQDQLKVNAYQIPPCNYKEVPKDVMKILAKPFDGFGTVSFWTYILGLNEGLIPLHKSITSPIKMAYSMFESDAIPELWVKILNTYYDLVVVPDEWHIINYKKSGVKIPIIVVPLGIMIENLLTKPLKQNPGQPFCFGLTAGFWERKNHIKLLQAFALQFGNDPKFKLKLHGRFGSYQNQVVKAVQDYHLNNVELLTIPLSIKDYDLFMEEIDCYVYPSKGEGFSITPREILALGKPCILSNNSAHRTICKTNLVVPLTANQKVPAMYEVFGNKQIGNFYDCSAEELGYVMKETVDHYDLALEKAKHGREWVKQYLWSELKPIYFNLLKPKNIILGADNYLNAEIFQLNDKKLVNKMKEAFKYE